MAGPPPPIRRTAPPPARRTPPPPTTTAPSPSPPTPTWKSRYVEPSEPVHMASAINGRMISTRCGVEAEGIEWTGYSARVTCPDCAVLPGVIHDTSVCPCSTLTATPELMERMLAGRKI